MTVHISIAVSIEATADATWRHLEQIESHVQWMADAESIVITSAQTSGVGTTFDCVTKLGWIRTTDVMCVTEWTPGKVMGVAHRGVVVGSGRFTLQSDPNGGTIFTWTESLRFPWWLAGPIGERIALPIFRRVWRGNLERLKSVVERNGAVPPGS